MRTQSKKTAIKRVINHAGIRREILLGQLSNSEISRQFGLSRTRIIQIRAEITRAQAGELSAPVNRTVSIVRNRVVELINQEVGEAEVVDEASKLTPKLTPLHARGKELLTPLKPDEIESAAERVVRVVREHRRDISEGRDLVQELVAELRCENHHPFLLEEIINEVTSKDQDPRRRNALQQAVSLPSRAATARQLTGALKHLIDMERQAFSVDKYASDLGSRQRRITIVVAQREPIKIEGDHD